MPACGSCGSVGRKSGCMSRHPRRLFEDGEEEVAELQCPMGTDCPGVNEDGTRWVCAAPFDPLDPDGLGLKFPYIDKVERHEDGTPKQKGPFRGTKTRRPDSHIKVPLPPNEKPPTIFELMKRALFQFWLTMKASVQENFTEASEYTMSYVNDPETWSYIKGVSVFVCGVIVFLAFSKYIDEETIRRLTKKLELKEQGNI